MPTVVLTIRKKDASMNLRVEGVCGPQCEDLIRPVVEKLGDVTSATKTDEYYQVQDQDQEVSQ